jgi:hypothetical protein
MRAETRSITIQAPPEDVLRFVADPFNLARWAPRFAPSVHERYGHWFIAGDFGKPELRVVDQELAAVRRFVQDG